MYYALSQERELWLNDVDYLILMRMVLALPDKYKQKSKSHDCGHGKARFFRNLKLCSFKNKKIDKEYTLKL